VDIKKGFGLYSEGEAAGWAFLLGFTGAGVRARSLTSEPGEELLNY